MSAELELRRLEDRVLQSFVVGTFLDQVAELRKLLALGDPNLAAKVLALVPPQIEGVGLAAVAEAYGIGRTDALGLIEDAETVARRTRRSVPSRRAREALIGIDKRGERAVKQAQLLARTGAEAAAFLAPVFGHANSITRSVTSSIVTGGSEGVTRVADVAGVPTVWIAETDACVDCLAYSGQVVDPGEQFPGGLTFDTTVTFTQALDSPPLHPNCRCSVEPLNDPSYAEALQREAERSVLRGFSLQSESMGVRVRAAEKLVLQGTDAPKSVVAYAESAIKRGKFITRNR